MKYFKDDADGIYITDTTPKPNWEEITVNEYSQLNIKPELTNLQKADALKEQLNQIEQRELMPRSQRETNIQLLTALAPSLGFTPQQVNMLPAMVKWKEIDTIAATIRAQIRALT
jgi:hypothetical protein